MASEVIEKGRVIAGRYVVDRRLGEGGMGSVYLVQHVHTDEQLALKILHSATIKDEVALERFRREARAPARINSDHVVRVTDADVAPEVGGAPFLVMEYLRGEDLDKTVESRGALPIAEVVLYLRQAARALDKAHSLGIIHRDLKPENLFVTIREDGTACLKLLDFGIAKLTGAASRELGRSNATTTGTIFGTPLYMAPEQAKGEQGRISPQTDVWALGLIAYRMLTGKDFWTAATITHLIAQIAYEKMPVPSERAPSALGPAFDAWFAACCAREVEDRFPTAGEAISALARALGVADVPTPPMSGGGLDPAAFGPRVHDPSLFSEVAARTLPASSAQTGGDTGASPLKLTTGPITRYPDLLSGRKKRAGAIVGAAVVIATLAGAALWMRERSTPDPTPVASSTSTPDPTSAAAPERSDVTTPAGPGPGTTAPIIPSVSPAVDQDAGAAIPATSAKASAGPRDRPTKPATSAAPVVTATATASSKPKEPPVVDPLSDRH